MVQEIQKNRRRPRSLVGATLLVCALSVSAAACGSGGGPAAEPKAVDVSATRLIAASADKAAAAKTARISGTISVRAAGKDQEIPIDGAVDLEHNAVQLAMDMGGLGLPRLGDAKFEARFVDGVMYLHLGDVGGMSSILGGKEWLKVDVSSVPGASGALGDVNPGSSLDALRGAGDVERVGTEEIGGVETTHYRVVIDPARALERVPAEVRDRARAGLEQLGARTPADVWLDADGQTRQISMAFETKAGRVSETLELSDYGAALDITAPPADEVGDFSGLFGRFGGRGSSGSTPAV
jgi:hypothetical protein